MELYEDFFWIDTNPKFIRWGFNLRPLVLTKDSIVIGDKTQKLGLKKYMFDFTLVLHSLGLKKDVDVQGISYAQAALDSVNSLRIPYSKIISVSKRNLFMGEPVINIAFINGNGDRKRSFYVCTGDGPVSEMTLKLYELLNSRIDKK